MDQTFTFSSEGFLHLCQVQHHGQLVYLAAVGQVPGRHDGRDPQLLLQDVEGQLVVVDRAGLVQGGHVSVEERDRDQSVCRTVHPLLLLSCH